jgi:hypothetical protein
MHIILTTMTSYAHTFDPTTSYTQSWIKICLNKKLWAKVVWVNHEKKLCPINYVDKLWAPRERYNKINRKKQKKKTDPRSENARSGRAQAKLVLRGVSTQAGQKDNDAMGGAIARSARCTSKGKELATSFDCASLASANSQRAQEARLLVMVEIAHTRPTWW